MQKHVGIFYVAYHFWSFSVHLLVTVSNVHNSLYKIACIISLPITFMFQHIFYITYFLLCNIKINLFKISDQLISV